MLESDGRGVARKKLAIEHAAESGGVRTLQIFIDQHPHWAFSRAFRKMLLGRERPRYRLAGC